MFVIYVDTVVSLRNVLWPLTHVSTKADIRCSAEKLTLIASPSSGRFVAALRMVPSFFNSFESEGDGNQEYYSRILLVLFARNLFTVHNTGISLTMYLREREGLSPLKFVDPATGYLQYSALVLSAPQNLDVSQIDYGMFVAIHSVDFLVILARLPLPSNDTVRVTLTKSRVKFSLASKKVVLTKEKKQCIIGGVGSGRRIQFLITLQPKPFFFHAAFMAKWVWLFKSTDSRDMMSFNMGLYANYLVSFNQDGMGRAGEATASSSR